MSTPTDESGGNAVRLVFSYQHETIRLVSQQRVDVAVTGFDAAPHLRSGDFVEVRDADGGRLSQVPIRTGLDTSIEVFPDLPGGQIVRVEAPQLKRVFTLVVPARTAAASIAVMRVVPPVARTTGRRTGASAELSADQTPAEVTELATFPLDRTSDT